MTARSPVQPGAPSPRATPNRPRDLRAARVLIVIAFGFALIVQNQFFQFSTAMKGDIEYHRGVAFTMTGGMLQGQGPLHGMISYFGGLYPMTLGWTSKVLGVSFDGLLSVLSWPFALALPLAFLVLGRSIWPQRALEPALLVFIGTIGSSLATDPNAEWVFSALPSGANEWPMFPRDVALTLVVLALAAACSGLTTRRIVIAGVLFGLAVATQAQVGAYGLAAACGIALTNGGTSQSSARRLRAAVVLGTIAVVTSAWWWLPRVAATVTSRHLLLASYPGLVRPDSSAGGMLNAFGISGILALGGLVVAVTSRRGLERTFGIWLAAFVPFLVVGQAMGDLGVITQRRVWFLAAIPVVLCATIGAAALARALPMAPTLAVLAIVLMVPSTLESMHARTIIDRSWTAPPAASSYGSAQWGLASRELRSQLETHHGTVVLAPDTDASFMWRTTGAQPFSLWLSGSMKLGFDPARLTSWSYLDRVRRQDHAFQGGIPGLCKLGRSIGAQSMLLRHSGPLLGTHDRRPASRWRVDPLDRTKASIRRKVAPDITYRDLNSTEALALTPGAQIPIGWASARVRRLDITLLHPPTRADPIVLRTAAGDIIRPRSGRESSVQFQVPGITPGTTIVVDSAVTLVRVTGFERSPVPLPPGPGVVNLALDRVCTP